MQVKLLRVLQEHKAERIGGEHSIDLDFRLITATNRNLEEMIAEGTFREDLYYRIDVIGLNIPPLRERNTDIEIFARMFLEELNQNMNGTIPLPNRQFLPSQTTVGQEMSVN